MLLKEALYFVEWNDVPVTAVVEIGVYRVRNDHQFFVVCVFAVFDHVGIGITAEIAGMRLLAMDQKDCAADLIAVLKDRLINKGFAADDVPAAVGIQGTGMVATFFRSSSRWAHIAAFAW